MPLVAPLVVGEVISPTAQTVLLNGLLPGIVIIAGGKTPPLRAMMAWAILVFRG